MLDNLAKDPLTVKFPLIGGSTRDLFGKNSPNKNAPKAKKMTTAEIEEERARQENERLQKIAAYKKEASFKLNNEWKLRLREIKVPDYNLPA